MNDVSIVAPERLNDLVKEAEEELLKIQPRIEELEGYAEELRELKLSKQRLLTLKMSLSTMIDNSTKDEVFSATDRVSRPDWQTEENKLYNFSELSTSKSFRPDEAFRQVDQMLKQKSSLNYEMFKAVVFNGGKASTEEIKAYLVENKVQQPQTGENFETVPLTEISSRANYMVRKGILHPMDRGVFYTHLGWVDAE